jgi:hypothetical protein
VVLMEFPLRVRAYETGCVRAGHSFPECQDSASRRAAQHSARLTTGA